MGEAVLVLCWNPDPPSREPNPFPFHPNPANPPTWIYWLGISLLLSVLMANSSLQVLILYNQNFYLAPKLSAFRVLRCHHLQQLSPDFCLQIRRRGKGGWRHNYGIPLQKETFFLRLPQHIQAPAQAPSLQVLGGPAGQVPGSQVLSGPTGQALGAQVSSWASG